MKKLLASFATALGLAALFGCVGASRVQMDPLRHRRRRWVSKRGAPMMVCGRCRKRVSARHGRRHVCAAAFIPAPPHGSRWQNGKLVARHARRAGAA